MYLPGYNLPEYVFIPGNKLPEYVWIPGYIPPEYVDVRVYTPRVCVNTREYAPRLCVDTSRVCVDTRVYTPRVCIPYSTHPEGPFLSESFPRFFPLLFFPKKNGKTQKTKTENSSRILIFNRGKITGNSYCHKNIRETKKHGNHENLVQKSPSIMIPATKRVQRFTTCKYYSRKAL